MGSISNLPQPPKFGTPKTGPAPQSLYEWMQFFRWLWQLFTVTQQTASIAQTSSQYPLPPIDAQRPFDMAAAQASVFPSPPRSRDELTAPAIMALLKPPYPSRQGATLIEDTHANRASYSAAAYPNWFYFETDTLVLYLSVAGVWKWAAGYNSLTQADLAAYAATLGATDVNTLAWVSDYAHMLQWTGAAWQRGPGDPEHSDTFWGFGAAPTDVGWHACDGAVVQYLKYDGTIANRTLPNANGTACYMKMGSAYAAAITAAALPSFAGTAGVTGATSAGTPAGTISTPTFTGNALGNHHHLAPIGSDVTNTIWLLNVNGTGGASGTTHRWGGTPDNTGNISPYQTSDTSAGTPSGSVSTPTFTGAALGTHTHSFTPAGTIALPGDPIPNFEAVSYYRQ